MYFDTVTIAAGQSTSIRLDLGEYTLCGVQIPAGMTGTALTFLGSVDDETYVPLKILSGTKLTMVIDATASVTAASPQDTACCRFIKVVSNAAEAAARDILLISVRAVENV